MKKTKIVLTLVCLISFFSVPAQAETTEARPPDHQFTIEAKTGLGTPSIQFDPAWVGNITTLYATSADSPWVYFMDYSLERHDENFSMISDNLIPQYIHALLFGYRYYFDFHWPLRPYSTLSFGVGAYSIGTQTGPTYFYPLLAGGIGGDYMLSPHLGINTEANLLLAIFQLKIGLKYIF